MRLLLVEDDAELARNVVEYLEPEHHVDHVLDGQSGLALCAASTYDAVLLDVMLPRLDGFEVCRRLREDLGLHLPVVMLTAKDTLEDKVAGFDAGADDYLVKPFALKELAVRLQALHRRTARAADEPLVLAFEDLQLDLGRMRASRSGRPLRLTRVGLTILERLLRAAPQMVRREQLERELWSDYPVGEGVLRTHVYSLRKQIDRGEQRPLVHTVHGIGYRLGAEDA
ncbi:MAG: response regulator transcription factor [Planctomycetota bacterium]|jgi:DNA-binding response OmpR family regulator